MLKNTSVCDVTRVIKKDFIKTERRNFLIHVNLLIIILILFGKGVYPYEYMNNWEKFSETSLAKKDGF